MSVSLLLFRRYEADNSERRCCYPAGPAFNRRGNPRSISACWLFSLRITANTAAPCSPDGGRPTLWLLINQAVEFGGVFAGDLVDDFGARPANCSSMYFEDSGHTPSVCG